MSKFTSCMRKKLKGKHGGKTGFRKAVRACKGKGRKHRK